MIEEVKKCDRCMCITDKLIDLNLLNRNVRIDDNQSDSREVWNIFTGESRYPKINRELCYECASRLLHWMGHKENFLTVSTKDNVRPTQKIE